jgi:hypothetical protein
MLIVGLEGTGFFYNLLRRKVVANIRKEHGSGRPSFRTHSHEVILHPHHALFAPDSSFIQDSDKSKLCRMFSTERLILWEAILSVILSKYCIYS